MRQVSERGPVIPMTLEVQRNTETVCSPDIRRDRLGSGIRMAREARVNTQSVGAATSNTGEPDTARPKKLALPVVLIILRCHRQDDGV